MFDSYGKGGAGAIVKAKVRNAKRTPCAASYPGAGLAVGLGLLLSSAWPLPAWASDSLRCGSRLVSVEARAADLLATCGEPAYRDAWVAQQGPSQRWVSDEEEWYYNFGSSQLLRVVKLRNGRIVDIDSDGYGFNDAAPPPRCEPASLVEGVSKYRLLRSCGEPLTRRAFNGYRPLRSGSHRFGGTGYGHRDEYLTPVYREEWVYNFGSRYLMRVVTLENGRVVNVDNAGRGSD